MRKPEELTRFDLFKIEEEKIRATAAESEKRCDAVIREKEKVRDAIKPGLAKAQNIVNGMIADFEKIEADLEGEELKRLDAQDLTKAAMTEGRITAEEYFRNGLTSGDATARAHAAAAAKLADLRDAIREKNKAILKLELELADAEYNIDFARTYPAVAFREKLAALLKAVDNNVGKGGELASKYARDRKAADLRIATEGRIPGIDGGGWNDYDLQGLRRLRFDPTFEADQLPRLDEIIAEAKATGRGVRLMIDPRDRKNPVNVMWGLRP
jgi:hypothetical protein